MTKKQWVASVNLVSAPVPLGLIGSLNLLGLDLGWTKRVWGLRVWGQGLSKITKTRPGVDKVKPMVWFKYSL